MDAALLTIRTYKPADLQGVISVWRSAMPIDPIPEAKFTRQVLLDQNFRSDGAIIAEMRGTVVGFCLAIARQMPLENAPSDGERGYITLIAVTPEMQRQGIGSKLLEQATMYLRSQNKKLIMLSSYAPGYFIPGVDVNNYPHALPFLVNHGFKEVYRPLAMEAPLWNFSIPDWVEEKQRQRESEGFEFCMYRPELTLPLLEFTSKEFPGDWVRVVRSTMDRILQGDWPMRLFIAHQNGIVYGFSHYENERFGPIGTAVSMRGKGLGQILMYKTLEAQRDQNFRSAWFLWSDDKTASRIYSAAGFKEVRRFALMKKDL